MSGFGFIIRPPWWRLESGIRRLMSGFPNPEGKSLFGLFLGVSLCAVHVRQFEGASPLSNLMEVKD
jgi:hypothetical protein